MDPTFKGLPTPLPTARQQQGPNFRLILLVASGFLLLIFVLGLLFSSGGSPTDTTQRLVYRIDALIALTSSAKSNIKDDELAKLNAELSLTLIGDQALLTSVLPKVKVDKTLTAIKKEEADSATLALLKDASVNGTHDTTYRSVLSTKIQETSALAEEVSSASSKKVIKDILTTLKDHLTIYFGQLESN